MNALAPENGKGGATNAPDPICVLTRVDNSAAAAADQAVPMDGVVASLAIMSAAAGIPVFSCNPALNKEDGAKKPYTPHGFKDATTDLFAVYEMWRQHPTAMIGCPTGAASGLVVLDVDVDPERGIDGPASLAALEAAHSPLPPTRMIRTPRGGVHYVYRWPGIPVKCSAGTLGSGLDIRGDGGYIILPGSRRADGAEYSVIRDIDPAPMPQWLLDKIAASRPSRPLTTDDPIPEGGRNDELTRQAGALRRVGMSPEHILATLRTINTERCVEPLDDDEVERIARSVGRYEPQALPEGDNAEIARLAALPVLAYEQARKAVAERLGMRVSVLDNLVAAQRTPAAAASGQGQALDLPSPDPWPEPVDGARLLTDLTAAISRYVVMEHGAADAVAMWVMHAHALDAAQISPRLAVTSPEKRCGKTLTLDVITRLVPRPLSTSNTTSAAIFRTVEAANPTLIIDEADTFISDDEEMRGILNSGHRRSAAWVLRLVGDDHEPRRFSTWAATVIAMIGSLPDTLEDRSVSVRLRRRRPDETVTPFRLDRTADLDRLASMAARWAADHLDDLRRADPDMPPALVNRAADNWRPLLAIADAAGGAWPFRARSVAEAAVAGAGGDAQSAKIMVLDDIRAAFEDRATDRLRSADLVSALVAMEGRPWAEWRKGKPLTQNSLARLLDPFRIAPGTIRMGPITAKGYMRDQFADAWGRYLSDTPPPDPSHRHTPQDC